MGQGKVHPGSLLPAGPGLAQRPCGTCVRAARGSPGPQARPGRDGGRRGTKPRFSSPREAGRRGHRVRAVGSCGTHRSPSLPVPHPRHHRPRHHSARLAEFSASPCLPKCFRVGIPRRPRRLGAGRPRMGLCFPLGRQALALSPGDRVPGLRPPPTPPHPPSISNSPWLFIATSANCLRPSLTLASLMPGVLPPGAIIRPGQSPALLGPGRCVLAGTSPWWGQGAGRRGRSQRKARAGVGSAPHQLLVELQGAGIRGSFPFCPLRSSPGPPSFSRSQSAIGEPHSRQALPFLRLVPSPLSSPAAPQVPQEWTFEGSPQAPAWCGQGLPLALPCPWSLPSPTPGLTLGSGTWPHIPASVSPA